MELKLIEVRSDVYCVPMIAIRLNPANTAQALVLRRAGINSDRHVALVDVRSLLLDPAGQDGDMRFQAHSWVQNNFGRLADGGVVDVEFILGKIAAPKLSDIQPRPNYQLPKLRTRS